MSRIRIWVPTAAVPAVSGAARRSAGVAVAIGKVIPEVSDGPHWPYVALGTLLALLGGALGAIGWWRPLPGRACDRLVAAITGRGRAADRGGRVVPWIWHTTATGRLARAWSTSR